MRLTNWNLKKGNNMKMKNIKTVCVAFALAVSAVGAFSGCAGDRYHESSGEYVDDSGLTSRVKSALGNDYYKYPHVKVVTFKGTVQLSGFVDDRAQKDRAGTIARGVQGIRQVDNNISIKG
jgi:hyperosmotically inducible periplasmic protein